MKVRATIQYDPRFIEEAVFHARVDGHAAMEIQRARNRVYEVSDPERRDDLFNDLNRLWFNRLGLGKIIDETLLEQTTVSAQVEKCFIVHTGQRKQEGAELFIAEDPQHSDRRIRTLRILLRPESLFETEALTAFLRHELFHIADMLDPAFAYEPTLPKADAGPTYDTLIINRYRVLWDVTINGRMLRRGWCDASVRGQQFSDFVNAFPMLEDRLEELFSRFFDSEHPQHADLACFAFDPRRDSGSLQQHASPGTHCPLCRFPTHAFEAEPSELGTEVLAALKGDFPNWTASQGLCTQCADLYRGRKMSLDALRLLPGYNLSSQRA
jgi:hypothetical protein